jgi:hypothetical protein
MGQRSFGSINYNAGKVLCFLLIFLTINCRTQRLQVEHRYVYRGQGLRQFPDSIVKKADATIVSFAPSWAMVDVYGGYDVPDSNNIAIIPDDIDRLKHLRVLNLAFNDVQTLPSSFHKLDRLEELDLSFNEKLNVWQAMQEIRQLKSLKKLNLYGILAAVRDSTRIRAECGKRVAVIVTKHDYNAMIVK